MGQLCSICNLAAAEPSPEELAAARRLPKVELHAHLNGCVRWETLRELAAGAGVGDEELAACRVLGGDSRPQAERWKLWSVIHRATASLAAVARITREMVEDYAADGCVWLEIRTTPKAFAAEGATKDDYVRTVCREAVREGAARGIVVKVLVSINRGHGAADAKEHVDVAARLRDEFPRVVAGVDFSGNYNAGPAPGAEYGKMDFLTNYYLALATARKKGLRLAVHFGERREPDTASEQLTMLQLKPDRLGHAAHVHPDAATVFAARRIPVEVCLTCHVVLGWAPSYAGHFARKMAAAPPQGKEEERHPIALCCDNTLVFSTSLAREYALATREWGLGAEGIRAVARRAAELCFFNDDAERDALMQTFA